jgi:CcmD family protein
MDQRNFTYMFYGLAAAWLIVSFYAVLLANRGKRIREQLDNLKRMVEQKERK